MTPIYDRFGDAVAWLTRRGIVDPQGRLEALIRSEGVFSPHGRYLGSWMNRVIRDRRGCIVAFARGASCGAVLPFPRQPQRLPLVSGRWAKLLHERLVPKSSLRRSPRPLLNWSALTWRQFLAGAAPPWPRELRAGLFAVGVNVAFFFPREGRFPI